MSSVPIPTSALFLIDSMSIVFQSFYAVRGLTSAEGTPTNAVFGFTRKIRKILEEYNPTHLAAIFESAVPTFRHEMYPEYKANREAAPEEFHIQIPFVFEMLEAMRIPALSCERFEADDVIGTLARRATDAGMQTVIISADKDLFQLVNDRVLILRPTKDGVATIGPPQVREITGVEPEQIVDYLALMGDTSDNIPGIPGIGPKTAATLLQKFGNLENLLQNAPQIANKRQQALVIEHADKARLSYRLAKIACDVPIETDPQNLICRPRLHAPEVIELYQKLGFSSLLREARRAPELQDAPDLFDNPPEDVQPPPPAQTRPQALPTQSRVILDAESLRALTEQIRRAGRVAFDTETTDVDPMRAQLVGLSFCCQPGEAWYIPVGHQLEGDAARQLPLETVRNTLNPVLADAGIVRIAQNAKYDLRVLRRHAFSVGPVHFDTMLASYVLNPEGRHGLKSLALALLGIPMTEISELIGKGKNAITMDRVEISRAAAYACADADMTLRLAEVLDRKLKENNLHGLFEEIEMPLVEALDAMEAEGVTLNREILVEISRSLKKNIEAVSAEIFQIAGRTFNIKSPKQVAEVLFEEQGLKPGRKTSTGHSTGNEVLEELAQGHPLPGRIIEFRRLDKLLSTYVDALPEMVHPETGRIHTSYNQCIAATGRLSSSNPNLQNIPVRSPEGREIRRAFIPNRPGEVFLAADYSQIELRILAHLSEDAGLRKAFQEDRDIHAQTAARIFDATEKTVTEDMRAQAKTINFGVLYGMSAHRLSRELAIPHDRAAAFIREYFEAYPGVRKWMEQTIAEGRKKGWVATLSGRRRPIPGLTSSNHNERANAERMAVNTPVQGTAADMIKFAMIALHQEIQEHNRRARMVLQVHDELVFSLPEKEAEAFAPVVRAHMQQALPISVPLKVDIKIGRNWAEC